MTFMYVCMMKIDYTGILFTEKECDVFGLVQPDLASDIVSLELCKPQDIW